MFMTLMDGLAWIVVIGAGLVMTGLVIVGIAGLLVKMGDSVTEATKGFPKEVPPPTKEELARDWRWY